ncbi:MAG: helicase [Gemmatimonadetes bacterium]|nr:helicase [Gemmatimonadota bacterium]|tara:strand:- start:1790 stop:3448 length:1659 start_codon:yes stop_codon:yes gene_type:complete
MAAGIGLNLANPQILRFFIDTAQTDGLVSELVWAGTLFLGVGFARQIVQLLSSYLGQDVGWRATNRMRNSLAHHCLNLDMGFHHLRTPGEMIERVDGDTTALSNFFSQFVLQIIGSIVFLIGVLVLVFMEDWRVGTALSLFSLVAFGVLNLTRSIAVPIYTAERESYARLYGFIEERLIGLEDIRTNGASQYATNGFHDTNNVVFARVKRSEVMSELLQAITGILFVLGYALAMSMGIWLYQDGPFTIGSVYLIFHYTSMLREPLFQLSRQINELQRATAGLQRIEELHRVETTIADGTDPLSEQHPLSVHFGGVTFAYNPGEPVLENVTFDIEPGKVLGLLGRTGSGKTTTTRLLFRFYDIQSGTIRLGDQSISDIQLSDLRKHVGLVTQDVQLFNATVRENLTLFNPDIPEDKIAATLDDLGLGPWYENLPNGLDTEIASGSSGLSAGEAQLLAFARVFLKDPGLVILDEPSSRLDPATERKINHAVEHLLENRTGIIIAHRLDTVETVDDIMILDGGTILEHGRRSDLVANENSQFSRLLKTGLEELIA